MSDMQQPMPDDDELDLDEAEQSADSEPTVWTQPTGSKVIVERFPDGVTMQVPPAGLIAGSKGMFVVAILWSVIVGIITVAFVLAFTAGNGKPEKSMLIPIGFISLFDLVGVGLLLASVNMGKRRAALAVTGGTLMVIQSGPFGTKQRDWPAGQVTRVCAGSSGMEVNEVPVLELQIHGADGKTFGLLAGRDDNELRWMASELRTALCISDPSTT